MIREGETYFRNNSLLSALSVPYVPYAALPHARHVDRARNTLEPLDVHRILLRKLSQGSVATAAIRYLVLALFEERDEGRDEEVITRNTHASSLVFRALARLEELFREAFLLTCANPVRNPPPPLLGTHVMELTHRSYGLHVVVNAHRP
jgi:hypothetical protein